MTKKPTQTANESKPHRQCGSMAVYERLSEMDAEFRAKQLAIESASREFVNQRSMLSARLSEKLTFKIPVIVHCLYNSNDQKITLAQVTNQIKILNEDFGLKNKDKKNIPKVWTSLASDTGIGFVLASTTPDGLPINGVTFTKTDRTGFGTGDTVKRALDGGVDPWDTKQYLNIWVAPLLGGLLGYAQFPGGPAATDGVVIASSAFGTSGTAKAPFNKGRTATHEVGHYLNLRHIWGDSNDCSGTDYCSDTPRQQGPNYNVPTFPHVSCNNGPNGDQFMNFMDYVDDAAMVMFTASQAARMLATLTGPRAKLVS